MVLKDAYSVMFAIDSKTTLKIELWSIYETSIFEVLNILAYSLPFHSEGT